MIILKSRVPWNTYIVCMRLGREVSASLEVFVSKSSIVDCIFQTRLVGYRRISTTKRAILHINTIMEAHQEVSDNFVPVFLLA